jgi:hypothetical protein
VEALAHAGPWARPDHVARALLAFTGGCGILAALAGAALSPSRRALALSGLAAAALFAPWLDAVAAVRAVDRLTGFFLAWGVLLTLWTLATGPRVAGRRLWLPWTLCVAVLQAAYWSVLARFIVFLLPPLTFWAAELLERRADGGRRVLAASLALTAALGAAVAVVDRRFADTEREFARELIRDRAADGRTIWCTAHWGLQEYLVAGGARQLDFSREGWDAVRPGDTVELSRVSVGAPPPRPMLADVQTLTVDFPLPLRHMSGWTGEGGFYASVTGVLPWSLSREPLQEYTLVRRR